MSKLKFNSQVCTTREQSQRLLELGLNPETADMSIITTPIDCDGIKYSLTPYSKINHPKVFGTIPAWSLHRLLCMLDYDNADTFNIMPNLAYKDVIATISLRINCGAFNKKYLKQ